MAKDDQRIEPSAQDFAICDECTKEQGKKVYVPIIYLVQDAAGVPWGPKERTLRCPKGHPVQLQSA